MCRLAGRFCWIFFAVTFSNAFIRFISSIYTFMHQTSWCRSKYMIVFNDFRCVILILFWKTDIKDAKNFAVNIQEWTLHYWQLLLIHLFSSKDDLHVMLLNYCINYTWIHISARMTMQKPWWCFSAGWLVCLLTLWCLLGGNHNNFSIVGSVLCCPKCTSQQWCRTEHPQNLSAALKVETRTWILS